MALVTGLTNNCATNVGGLSDFWAIDVADFTSAAVVANVVPTIVVSGTWKKYEFMPDTGQRVNSGERSETGAFPVTHSIDFRRLGIDEEVVTSLHEFISSNPCGIIGVCKDMNGKKWLEGYSETLGTSRPLKLMAGNLDSGKAITDGAGVDFSIGSSDGHFALEYTGADPS